MKRFLYVIAAFVAVITFSCDTTESGLNESLPDGFTLTTNIEPEDAGSVEPSGGEFEIGSTVELEAIPAEGYIFDRWGGDLSGSENPGSITFDQNRTVTAYFIDGSYDLTIEVIGEGSVLEELLDSESGDEDVSASVQQEQDTLSDRIGEREQQQQFDIDADTNLDTTGRQIERGQEQPEIAQGQEQLEQQGQEGGFTQIQTQSVQLQNQSATVRLTAEPDSAWQFDRWEGDLSGNENPAEITIPAGESRSVTAVFVSDEAPELEITRQPGETVAGEAIEGPPSVRVQDHLDDPVEGIEVTVSLLDDMEFDGGTTTVESDGEGMAEFDDLVIQTSGSYTLRFTIEGDNNSKTSESFDVVAADAADVSVEVIEDTAAADGNEELEFLVTVEDAFENRIPNVEVTASDNGSDITYTGDGSSQQTDSSGQATFTATSTTDQENVTFTFTEQDNNNQATAQGSFEDTEGVIEIDIIGEGTVSESLISGTVTDTGYLLHSDVELTANPAEEWEFIRWEGDLTGDENPIMITVDEDKMVTAVFETVPLEDQFTLVDLTQYGLTNAVDINDHGDILGGDSYWNSNSSAIINIPLPGPAMKFNNNRQVISRHHYWDENAGVVEIDTLPYGGEGAHNFSHAYDINDDGYVVGEAESYIESPEGHTVEYDFYSMIWENGSGSPDTFGWFSTAHAISNNNQITGFWVESYHFYITDHLSSGFRDVGFYDGFDWGESYAINNNGQVVGSIQTTQSNGSNLLASSQSRTDGISHREKLLRITNTRGVFEYGHVIQMLRNSTISLQVNQHDVSFQGFNQHQMINEELLHRWSEEEQRQIIETSLASTDESRAFIWDEQNGIVSLGTLGGTWSTAFDINDHGQVVGYSDIGNGQYRAFYWDAGRGLIELPSNGGNSIARAINNQGQIVGVTTDQSGNDSPVMWELSFEP